MSKTLSQSQHDSIRHILETTSMPKLEIARRFNCSAQTIHRINNKMTPRQPSSHEMSEREASAKMNLDAAFNAFERCSSPENYRRLNESRYAYETVSGPIKDNTVCVHSLVA
jgi:predicted GTPase